eukprot:1496-Heterococcus_DN1.PRE.1
MITASASSPAAAAMRTLRVRSASLIAQESASCVPIRICNIGACEQAPPSLYKFDAKRFRRFEVGFAALIEALISLSCSVSIDPPKTHEKPLASRESANAVDQRGPAQDWLISSVADVLAQVHKETPLCKDTVAAIKGALNSSGFKALPEDTKITLTAVFHEVTGRLGRAWDTVQLTINRLLLENRTQVAQRLAELQTQAQDLHNCLMGAAHLGDALPHLAAFASAAGPLKQSDLSLHFSADDHTPLISICLNSGSIAIDNSESSSTQPVEHDEDESDSSVVQQRDEICYRILHVCTLDELYMLLPEVEQMNTMYGMDVDTSPTLNNDDSSINSSSVTSETPVLAALEYQTQAHARLSNTLKLGARLITHHPVVVASVYQEWLTDASTSSDTADTCKTVSADTWQRQEAVYKNMQRSSFSTASQPEVSTDHTVGFNITLGNSSNNCSSNSTSQNSQQQQQQQALATRSAIIILTAFCD